jgi:2-polyprenyl-6-methoxyphenol hydroxylase-like FAD-dependent oxidoreductase
MDTQVIVVGAGPVGLMLAAELRLGGAEVVVVERLAAPMTESRASTLHARTMETFDQRGLLDRLGDPPQERMGHFGGLPLDLGHLRTRFPGQWKVPQARVEAVLARWADELGADLWRGHELVDLTVGTGLVRARLAGPGGPVDLSGGYLVGCDGERSTVRRLAGIGFPGSPATRLLLRADVAGVTVSDRRFERLPGGLAIAARRPDGVTRVMVSDFTAPARHNDDDPSFVDVCRAWHRVTGEDISSGVPLWVNAFGNASRLAGRYRDGRVLLAGDAAHQQMPAGGQAINLGLQDAVNLGWKLAAEVGGRAPTGLLDTYHQERHPVAARVLGAIETQALLLLGERRVEPLRAVWAELLAHPRVRDHLASTISGLDVRYGDGRHLLVGARMPHIELVTAGGAVTSTTTLLRRGRSVLLDLSADPVRRRWLREVTSGWRWLEPISAAPAPASAAAGWETMLIRPDGYLAWVGSRAADPRPALRRWVGHPAREAVTTSAAGASTQAE